jgi:hypothetical protein
VSLWFVPLTAPRLYLRIHFTHQTWESPKSKQLLEIAKIGGEKAIETDEETATASINQQLESLGVKLI